MIGATLLATAAAALGLLGPAWPPAHLELGINSVPGDAAHARALHVRYRYQYLAGGVDTGQGWSTWNPDGTFVSRYVTESYTKGLVPFFSYYMMLQSRPHPGRPEDAQDLGNLDDATVMKAYYDDVALMLRRAHEAAHGRLVILHLEPDLFGYIEQRSRADDASTVPAAVASTGDPRLAGLPNTAAGFVQAIVRLRDQLAPEVRVGVHMSAWGTNVDPFKQDPDAAATDRLARRSARFLNSLHARFDMVVSDPADRDDGFNTKVRGDHGASRWSRGDYRRDIRWLRVVHRATKRPIVMWQIPLGNSHLPNRAHRYRDTHVQTLLGRPGILKAYRDAGLVALLFGGGAEGTTTDRTDGGLFRRLARGYVRKGPLRVRSR